MAPNPEESINESWDRSTTTREPGAPASCSASPREVDASSSPRKATTRTSSTSYELTSNDSTTRRLHPCLDCPKTSSASCERDLPFVGLRSLPRDFGGAQSICLVSRSRTLLPSIYRSTSLAEDASAINHPIG